MTAWYVDNPSFLSLNFLNNITNLRARIVFLALLFTFGIPLLVVFLIYYFENVRKSLELAKMGKLKEYHEAKNVVREKEIVVKEVVMVPCRYCHGLMPNTSIFCPNCGAPEKCAS